MIDASAPLCCQCGGVWTNPAAKQCMDCGWPVGRWGTPFRPPIPHFRGDPRGGETSLFWLRVAVIAIAVSLSVIGACVSALAG